MHLGLPIFSLLSLCPISQQLPLALTAGLGSPNTQHSKPLPTSLWIWSCLCRNVGLFCQQQICLLLCPLGLFLIFSTVTSEVQTSVPKLVVHWILSAWGDAFLLQQSPLLPRDGSHCLHTARDFMCFVLMKGKQIQKKIPQPFFPLVIICLVPKCWSWSWKYGTKVEGENQTA